MTHQIGQIVQMYPAKIEISEKNPPSLLSQGGMNPFRAVEDVIASPTSDIAIA